jgi:protein-S-isoprenylcysteine O-methyltransferase Ste14
MTLTPAFEIGIWNAWIFIVPYIFLNFGVPFLFVRRKSTFWTFPSYTRPERMCLVAQQVIMGCLCIYSIFLPLAVGTAWFYAGLPVYILGFAFITIAMLTFIATPVEKPNTTGLYRFSRHPMYLGTLLVYIGISIASASWVYLLLALAYFATYRIVFIIPEERMCCEKFGDAYCEYTDRTPRWIGIPKAVKRTN